MYNVTVKTLYTHIKMDTSSPEVRHPKLVAYNASETFGCFLSIRFRSHLSHRAVQVMALSFWVAVTDRDVQLMGWYKICCSKSWRCFRRSGSYGFLVLLEVILLWSVCGWRICKYYIFLSIFLWLWSFTCTPIQPISMDIMSWPWGLPWKSCV